MVSRLPSACRSLEDDIARIKAVLEEDSDLSGTEDDYDYRAGDLPDIGSFNETSKACVKETDANISEQDVENIKKCLDYHAKSREHILMCLDQLRSLEEEIESKEEGLQSQLVKCLNEKVEGRRLKLCKTINVFATPYFRDIRKSIPSPNEDSIIKRINNDIDAYTAPPKPWIDLEFRSLKEAVIKNARQQEIEPLTARCDYYKGKLQNDCVTEEQITETTQKLKKLENEIKNVKKKTDEELIAADKELDWMRISKLMVFFYYMVYGFHHGSSTSLRIPDSSMEFIRRRRVGNRTADECERMWVNYLHPSINKKHWTKAEDKELIKVARRNDFQNWDKIASELKLSKRKPIQCFERYQSHLNRRMLKGVWTTEDDEELKRAIEECRIGEYIPWRQVCHCIEGRSRNQIVIRWYKTLSPSLKREPFSRQEDAVLLAGVEKYGYQWAKIKELLPGRSAAACTVRYTGMLIPGVTIGNWTPEENLLLFKLMQKYPEGEWTKIASHLPGRSPNSCLYRASQIQFHYPHLFKKKRVPHPVEVNDSSELATPTYNLRERTKQHESIRLTAEQNMLETLKKMKGIETVEEAREFLKSSNSSRLFLMDFSKKLLSSESRNKKRVCWEPRWRRGTPKSTRISDSDLTDSSGSDGSDSSFDIDDPNEFNSENEDTYYQRRIKSDEELSVEAELDRLFMPVVTCGIEPSSIRRYSCQSRRRAMEHKALTSLLYKALKCVEDQSEECEDFVYRGIDFGITVPSVCHTVVFPSSSEIPSFPPNRVTLEAFKILLINRSTLLAEISEKSCADFNTLSIIRSNESCSLFCPSCCIEKGKYISQQNVRISSLPEENPSALKELGTEIIKNNQLCNKEPAFDHTSPVSCSECQRLNELREEYHLFRKRLYGIFLWPALLAEIKPSDEQKASLKNMRYIRPKSLVDDSSPSTSQKRVRSSGSQGKFTESESSDEEYLPNTGKRKQKAAESRMAKRHASAVSGAPRSLPTRRSPRNLKSRPRYSC